MAFSFRLENGPFHLTLNGPSRPTLTVPDTLHELAMQLPDIINPAIIFSKETHDGKYNDLTDEDFEAAIHAIKSLQTFWYDPEEKKNNQFITVFDLLVKLLEEFLRRSMSEYVSQSLRQFK